MHTEYFGILSWIATEKRYELDWTGSGSHSARL